MNGRVEDVNNIPALRCSAVSSLFLSFHRQAPRRRAASVQMCQIKGQRVCGPHGDSLKKKKKKNILQGIGGLTQPEISLRDVPPLRLRAQ